MSEKDIKIIEMVKAGKSYTDIQAELKVSPSKIAVIKKQYLLTTTTIDDTTTATTEKDISGLKEKMKQAAQKLINENEYFDSKGKLWQRLIKLGYSKGNYNTLVVKKDYPKTIRIQLQNYIITRISLYEYMLQKSDIAFL